MSIYEDEKIEKITDRIKKVGSQLYQDLTTYITAINLAFGKGNSKRQAFRYVMITALYESSYHSTCYLKLNDITDIKFDEENEKEIIIKYGNFDDPKVGLYLHIEKGESHYMYLVDTGIYLAFERPELLVAEFLIEQSNKNNLSYVFRNKEFKIEYED